MGAQDTEKRSPLAIRMLKSAFNAELDGQAGIQELAGNSTLLYYLSDEAKEGKNAFLENANPTSRSFRSSLNGETIFLSAIHNCNNKVNVAGASR